MSTGEVAARVRAAYALLNASPALGQARQRSAEAADVFDHTVDGTTNATAKATAALLASVPDLLDEIAAAIGQGNQAARDYLSAIGADGGTPIVGDQVVDPGERAGTQTLDADENGSEGWERRERRRRRAAKFVDKSTEAADELAEAAKTRAEDVINILSRPAGHATSEVDVSRPTDDQVNVPEMVSSLTAVGVLTAKVIMTAVERWRTRGKDDDGH
ncbi:hypothetical protein [Actinocatenispora rupis]|uniref:Uncharacterized protein n=1 Tax=Actinocatenispora rupis TaxID=519421 RepID=A0A8J3J585_9ACTN|nr:hypothetical protein [Actinocatenispora rupis]GID12370.1 hypothetical protein Aru02nite_32590 [Actinocatenispora rupis]